MKISVRILLLFFIAAVSGENGEDCPRLDYECYNCLENVMVDNCPICQCKPLVDGEAKQWGGIFLTSEQVQQLQEFGYERKAHARAGSTDLIPKWDNLRQPDGMCRVPYYLDSNPPFSDRGKEIIHRAISALHSQTCVRFDPAKVGDESIIRFKNSSECSTFIGREKGVRTIHGCTRSVGEALQAAVHALGFWSEINRGDRDDYVIIIPQNMLDDKIRYTMKVLPHYWANYNLSYDFQSITHLGAKAYSAFGGATILVKSTKQLVEKNKWALSAGDLKQIRIMYNCSGVRGVAKTTTCYYNADRGLRYRGNVSVTRSGTTCQQWDGQTPHAHKLVSTLLTGSGLKDNHCRNPDMRDQPWCYSTNSSIRWEYCNISVCNASDLLEIPIPLPTPIASVKGFWSFWSEYSSCSTTCGYGYKYSTRRCVGGRPQTAGCPGKSWRYLTCNSSACPLSDRWHEWENWSECKAECGSGNQTRVRYCVGLVGRGGCVNSSVETVVCNTGRTCPLYKDGGCYNSSDPHGYKGTITFDSKGNKCFNWSDTKLNVTAYPNFDLMNNYCRNPDGRRKVPYCFHQRNKRNVCNVTKCNLDALWEKWGPWSDCSSTCGNGTRLSTRRCKKGHYGEGSCLGSVTLSDICNVTCIGPHVIDVIRKPLTPTPVPTTTPGRVECLDPNNPRSYRGSRRWTKSGYYCQHWGSSYPWKHNYTDPTLIAEAGLSENFCRTPDPNDTKPWCFVQDFHPKKEICDVPNCPYSEDVQDLSSFFAVLWSKFLKSIGIGIGS